MFADVILTVLTLTIFRQWHDAVQSDVNQTTVLWH